MADKAFRSAGVISAALAILLCLVIYLLFATVDVVFISEDCEIYRLNDVSVISDLSIPEGYEATYVYGDAGAEFNDGIEFRLQIGTTLLTNLFTFKWEDTDNVITVTKQ